jgi:hypothetical protein
MGESVLVCDDVVVQSSSTPFATFLENDRDIVVVVV